MAEMDRNDHLISLLEIPHLVEVGIPGGVLAESERKKGTASLSRDGGCETLVCPELSLQGAQEAQHDAGCGKNEGGWLNTTEAEDISISNCS